MRLTDVLVAEKTLPVERLNTSYGEAAHVRNYVFLCLRTDEGVSGFGEAACLTRFTGETPSSVAALLRNELREFLIGRDPFGLDELHRALNTDFPHNPTAVAAVDMAVHDLMGKALGRPVVDLLGGAVRDELDIAGAVGIEEPRTTAKLAAEYARAGCKAVKLKVGQDLDRDAAAVEEVRRRVGDNVALRLDANQGLTLDRAYQLMRAVEPHDIQYIEQPVASWDVQGLAELRREGGVAVAADESNLGMRQALALLQKRAVDYLVVKLVKCGGLHPARQIIRLAGLHRIPCTLTSPYETSIGAAANVHLAAATYMLSGPIEVLDTSGIAGDPGRGLEFSAAKVRLPIRPGLGIGVEHELFN